MKKLISTCVLFLSLMISSNLIAQDNQKSILPFNEGKVLTDDDISFIKMLSEGVEYTKNEESVKSSIVTIGDYNLSVGESISKEAAQTINEAIKAFQEDDDSSDFIVNSDDDTRSFKKSANAPCGYYCYYWYWNQYCQCYQRWHYWCCL